MSGMWKMLETSGGLLVSPPDYHAHRQLVPHWLDRDGVSYKEMDKARIKCEQWIDEYYEYLNVPFPKTI